MPRSYPRLLPAVTSFLVALAVRLLWVADLPAYADARSLRRIFDGHERLYLDAFAQRGLADASPSFHPLLGHLAQALGAWTSDPRALLLMSAIAGAWVAAAVSLWTSRHARPVAGLWAGLLAALHPGLAAWSTSYYPVILPLALLAGALVARRPTVTALLCFGAGLLRPELGLLSIVCGRPGLAGWAGAASWVAWLGAPPVGASLENLGVVLQLNLPLVEFLGPPVLVLGLLGLGAPRGALLAACAVGVHLLGCGFDDYGTRHALLGGAALCALGGVAAARQGALLGVLLVAGMATRTAEMADRWVHPADLAAAAQALPPPDRGRCQEVGDEPILEGQAVPSHLSLWRDPVPEGACVLWGEEGQHRAWSSRGLADRAARMRLHYAPRPVAAERVPGGWRLYHQLQNLPPERP